MDKKTKTIKLIENENKKNQSKKKQDDKSSMKEKIKKTKEKKEREAKYCPAQFVNLMEADRKLVAKDGKLTDYASSIIVKNIESYLKSVGVIYDDFISLMIDLNASLSGSFMLSAFMGFSFVPGDIDLFCKSEKLNLKWKSLRKKSYSATEIEVQMNGVITTAERKIVKHLRAFHREVGRNVPIKCNRYNKFYMGLSKKNYPIYSVITPNQQPGFPQVQCIVMTRLYHIDRWYFEDFDLTCNMIMLHVIDGEVKVETKYLDTLLDGVFYSMVNNKKTPSRIKKYKNRGLKYITTKEDNKK